MRKKILAAIALLGAFLVGCSSDDSSSDNTLTSPSEAKADTTAEATIDSARYTVIVYGNAGGYMDSIVEGVYEQMQPIIESKDVRVFFFYKYGMDSSIVDVDEDGEWVKKPFNGKYAEPGQMVAFELTKDFDLKTISEDGLLVNDAFQLHTPGVLSFVLDYVADSLPAKNYVFVLWGHGGGFDFDNDFPKELRAPETTLAKSQNMLNVSQKSAAVLYDEGTLDLETGVSEGLNMYEFKQEIEKSSIKHFKGIYFHNCFMGNFETLSEVYPLADYIIASEHVLESDGTLVTNLVKELYKNSNFQAAAKASFEDSKSHWMKENKGETMNGDLSLLRASEISSFFPIFKKIGKRLRTLYKDPVQKANIDYASVNSYVAGDWDSDVYFTDALHFVNNVANATEDSTLAECAKDLQAALEKLVLKNMECHYNKEYNIPSFSLSVVLAPREFYRRESVWGYTNKDAYEYSTFHKNTGWGEWLNVNAMFDYFAGDEDESQAEE